MSFARAERRRQARARAENPREWQPADGKYGHPSSAWRRGSPRYGWTWFGSSIRGLVRF